MIGLLSASEYRLIAMSQGSESRCAVTRGEVDLSRYAELDGEWRKIGLAAPARRALVDSGLTTIAHLTSMRRSELMALHGMGQHALRRLEAAMREQGWALIDE